MRYVLNEIVKCKVLIRANKKLPFFKIVQKVDYYQNVKFQRKTTFHRPVSEPYTSLFHLKHSGIDRSRPQLIPGMFFTANGCLTVENELSEVSPKLGKNKTLVFL